MTKNPASLYAIFKEYGKPETFTCDRCQRVFYKKWSDDEAIEEMRMRFPDAPTDEVLLICDDCVDKIELKTEF